MANIDRFPGRRPCLSLDMGRAACNVCYKNSFIKSDADKTMAIILPAHRYPAEFVQACKVRLIFHRRGY